MRNKVMVPSRFPVVPEGRELNGNEWFPVPPIGGEREPLDTVSSCKTNDRESAAGGGNRSAADAAAAGGGRG